MDETWTKEKIFLCGVMDDILKGWKKFFFDICDWIEWDINVMYAVIDVQGSVPFWFTFG